MRAAGLKIETPTASNPMIVIRRVRSDMEADELVSCIFKQNLGDMKQEVGLLKPAFRKGKKTASTVDWVLVAHPVVKDKLVKLGRVYIVYAPPKDPQHESKGFEFKSIH